MRAVVSTRAKIFLDLKLHDIPNTVAKAVEAAGKLGVRMLTIHLSGGSEMIRAAAAARSNDMLILGVTVLTSSTDETLAETGVTGKTADQVLRLARLGVDNGIDGLVASPHEARMLRAEFGDEIKIVTPGIRPAGSAAGDQKRFATPREAHRCRSRLSRDRPPNHGRRRPQGGGPVGRGRTGPIAAGHVRDVARLRRSRRRSPRRSIWRSTKRSCRMPPSRSCGFIAGDDRRFHLAISVITQKSPARPANARFVRRWTGGGIVPHGDDLTYSVIVPAAHPLFERSSPEIYSRLHDAIRRALEMNGVAATLAVSAAPKISDDCFANAVRADVMSGGRKIAGAAHRRTRSGLLHQGSIQQSDLPGRFKDDFARILCGRFERKTLSANVIERARRIADAKYATPEWLRRR